MTAQKSMTPLQGKILLGGLGLFVGVAGWSAFNQGYRGMYEVGEWKPVQAVVISSKVVTSSTTDESTASRRPVTVFLPVIRYRYKFAGREYTSDQYSLHYPAQPSYAPVKKIVEAHQPGTRFTVYVNPHKPGEAVINRDREPAWPVMIFGGVFMVLGAGMLLAAIGLLFFGRVQK